MQKELSMKSFLRAVGRIADRLPFAYKKERSWVLNYLFAIFLVVVAFQVRLYSAPLSSGVPYVSFFPAVALAAIFGGFWTGMFVTVISLFLAAFIFTPPYYSISLQSLNISFWSNLLFLIDGVIVCASIQVMHRYRNRYARELVEIKRQAVIKEALLKRNQVLMQNSLDGIHIMDVEGKLIEANDAFCGMLGYTQKDVNSLKILDWTVPTAGVDLSASLQGRIGNSAKFETIHRRKDGTLINVEISASGEIVDGQPLIFASSRDITQRKLFENEMQLENLSERRRAKALEQKFGHLLQSSFNEIYLIDASSLKLLQSSAGAQKNLGYTANELKQLSILDIRQGYTREGFDLRVAPLLEGKEPFLLFNTFHQRKDGTTYPVEVRLQYMNVNSPVFLAIAHDISERELAEENNRKLTRALKLLSECGTLLIYADNEKHLLEATCKLAVDIGGYKMAWVGFAQNDSEKSVLPIACAGDKNGYLANLKISWAESGFGLGPTGTAIRTGTSVINMNSQTSPQMAPWSEAAIQNGFQSSIALPLVCYNNVLGALTIYSAASQAFAGEEVTLLEELANNLAFGIETLRTRTARLKAEQETRELSKHIQTIREEEKANFAREIHDDLGGTLAALKMDAHWLMKNLVTNEELLPLHECAKSMVNQLDNTVAITRHLITELRPTILDDLGLMEAIRWKTADFRNRSGIACRFICTGAEGSDCMNGRKCEGCKDDLDPTQSINLFRIAQEALTNIIKHSRASKVEVSLQYGIKETVLTICDNGCGLPPKEAMTPASFGLRGMRERMELLNGEIKFTTPQGGGLCVTAILPKPTGSKVS